MNKRLGMYLLLVLLILLSLGLTLPKIYRPTAERAAYSVRDATGYTLYFPHKPVRIVSLSVTTDEILADMTDLNKIVGMSYLADDAAVCNTYEKARQVQTKLRGENIEQIVALRPDLVIVTTFHSPELVGYLRSLGINVYVYPTLATIPDIERAIAGLGAAVGESAAAAELIAGMERELAEIAARLATVPPKNIRALHMDSDVAYYAKHISLNDIYARAGIKNVTNELNSDLTRFLSKEEIVALDPELILLTDWGSYATEGVDGQKAMIMADPAYQTIQAVRKEAIFGVQGKHLLTTSHYIVRGVRDVAKIAYPEAFDKGKDGE